jgi:hypothetical protein
VEGDLESIPLKRGEPWKRRQPRWLDYWPRFHRHLVAGNTPQSFFETLSASPEAAR